MHSLTNINIISKAVGGLTSAYATYQILTIGNNIVRSKHKTKALHSNLVPLIHASLGLSLGSMGAGLADLSLATGGALHLVSQQMTNSFFNSQNAERQKEMSYINKQLTASSLVRGCCASMADDERTDIPPELRKKVIETMAKIRLNAYINSVQDNSNKDALVTKATDIFNKLKTNSWVDFRNIEKNENLSDTDKATYKQILSDFPDETLIFSMTDKERNLFKTLGDYGNPPQIINSNQPIQFKGKIIEIFELKDELDFEDVKSYPKPNEKENEYGRFLSKDETISVDTTNDDGQGTKQLKFDDIIPEGTTIKGNKKYQIMIEPAHETDPYKNHALENIQKQQNHFHWDLPTMLASASLAALIGTVALGTPILRHEINFDTLNSLGKTIKWGAAFASALMPCGVNAANMRGHIAYYLEKDKKIIIKTPELLDKLADMKIGEDKSDYHFLVDFNGTLTKGSEFVALKSSDSKEFDTTKLSEILQPIVAMGDAKNSTHHIHKALKEKLQSLHTDKTQPIDTDIDKSKVVNLEGKGTYYLDDKQQYAIGNEELIKEFLKKISDKHKKTEINKKLDILKQQEYKNAVTFVVHNNEIYALETHHKLRDDAKDFLEKHKGHFTVLTGAKLTDDVKNKLGLTTPDDVKKDSDISKINCHEGLKPEDKKKHAETLKVDGRYMPKEKIVAFGDGGNDWGMFHTVNVATQLTDISAQENKKNLNLADVFSDMIIPNLSDFDTVNNIAKKQRKPQIGLNVLGLLDMAWGANMVLSHTHHHNPLYHTLHHLGSIAGFYLLGSVVSKDLVNQQIKATDRPIKRIKALFN